MLIAQFLYKNIFVAFNCCWLGFCMKDMNTHSPEGGIQAINIYLFIHAKLT